MSDYITSDTLLLTLDLAGTTVFAISGAAVGVKHRLDVFGVCVSAAMRQTMMYRTGDLLHLPPVATTVGGAAFCFAIRLAAIRRGWSLPTADVVQGRP